MEQENKVEEREVTATETTEAPGTEEKPKRKKWELLTVKYFQILLDYNLFRYGGKGEVLK